MLMQNIQELVNKFDSMGLQMEQKIDQLQTKQ